MFSIKSYIISSQAEWPVPINPLQLPNVAMVHRLLSWPHDPGPSPCSFAHWSPSPSLWLQTVNRHLQHYLKSMPFSNATIIPGHCYSSSSAFPPCLCSLMALIIIYNSSICCLLIHLWSASQAGGKKGRHMSLSILFPATSMMSGTQ